MTTLSEALEDVTHSRWAGMRTEKRNVGQALYGVRAIQLVLGVDDPQLEEVTKDCLKAIVRQWRGKVTPATIILRLNCLSALGVDVKGCRPRVQRKLKWWLDADGEEKIVAWLTDRVATGEAMKWAACHGYAHFGDRPLHLANLIRWTTRTGLRIEESLRLTWSDIKRNGERWSVTVPGLKTGTAQASLVLSKEAILVLETLPSGAPNAPLFDIPYPIAARLWMKARTVLELPDPSIATMKALRRSAARNLHTIKGMPLDMVRTYLRHENVQTTMGYLRLTGGYNEEEMAKWL